MEINMKYMNKHIEKLVTLLYEDEKYKYDNFFKRGKTLSFFEHLNEMFEQQNNIKKDQELYWVAEEYHINNLFDNVIDKIEVLYIDNKNNKKVMQDYLELYTGYNFDINTSLCNKLNDISKKYPIYIRVAYNENDNTYGASLSKTESKDKIIIELNAASINDNIDLLRSTCKHELLHIRESYAKEYVDVLQSKKNRLPDKNTEQNVFTWNHSDGFFKHTLRVCYLFNKAEMRARLNGVYEYVKKEDTKLSELDNITLLSEMKDKIIFMKMLKSQNNYSALEIYNYYLVKYNIIKTKFINYHFNEKIMQISKYTNDELDRLDAMIFELQEQYMKFKRDIQKVIYNKFHK